MMLYMKHDSGYLHNAIDAELVKASVDNLVALIRLSNVEFDTIVFRGMSGALIAPTVGYILGKEIVMIRKNGDDAHTSRKVEGHTQLQNFIIIDDFISSGETMREIFKAMWIAAGTHEHWQGIYKAKCAGIFCTIAHHGVVWTRANILSNGMIIVPHTKLAFGNLTLNVAILV